MLQGFLFAALKSLRAFVGSVCGSPVGIFIMYLWTGMAKATHGNNVCHSFSALSAGAPIPPHTPSPASGISPCACDHSGLWACLESCGL